MNSCPMCGAPFEGSGECEYCGYMPEPAKGSKSRSRKKADDEQEPERSFASELTEYPRYAETGIAWPSRRKKIVALILCIFGGLFGVHRFYVGRLGTGALYPCAQGMFLAGVLAYDATYSDALLWVSLGLMVMIAVCWIADLIRIATGSFADVYGLRLGN